MNTQIEQSANPSMSVSLKRKPKKALFAGLVALILVGTLVTWWISGATNRQLESFRAAIVGGDVTLVPKVRELATLGNAEAQYMMGLIYMDGVGARRDNAEAVAWFLKAGKQGHAEAQNNLGYMYLNAQGVERNVTESVAWYKKGVDGGSALAQTGLAMMFDDGVGVERSPNEATRLFLLAAKQGNSFAQLSMGMRYLQGKGVEIDNPEAVKWLRRAAVQRNSAAQSLLGSLYVEGRGVEKSYMQAYKWQVLAVAVSPDRNPMAARDRDSIGMSLTPEQRDRAIEMAKKCAENEYRGCD